MAVTNDYQPTSKRSGDVAELLAYADDNPDGFFAIDACIELEWYRRNEKRDELYPDVHRYYRAVRGVRRYLTSYTYNLINLPEGPGAHRFWLADAGDKDDRDANREWSRRFMLGVQTQLRTISVVNESLSTGIDRTTPEGRKIERRLRMLGFIAEELSETMAEYEVVQNGSAA